MGHASADGGHEHLLLSGVTSEAACCECVVRGAGGSKLPGTAVSGCHIHTGALLQRHSTSPWSWCVKGKSSLEHIQVAGGAASLGRRVLHCKRFLLSQLFISQRRLAGRGLK